MFPVLLEGGMIVHGLVGVFWPKSCCALFTWGWVTVMLNDFVKAVGGLTRKRTRGCELLEARSAWRSARERTWTATALVDTPQASSTARTSVRGRACTPPL